MHWLNRSVIYQKERDGKRKEKEGKEPQKTTKQALSDTDTVYQHRIGYKLILQLLLKKPIAKEVHIFTSLCNRDWIIFKETIFELWLKYFILSCFFLLSSPNQVYFYRKKNICQVDQIRFFSFQFLITRICKLHWNAILWDGTNIYSAII